MLEPNPNAGKTTAEISAARIAGEEVKEQAVDNSLTNREPALIAGSVVWLIGAVGSVLVIGGVLDEDQRQALVDNVGVIVPALLLLGPIISSVWTRMKAYAPRTAARIAVANAAAPMGTPPALIPPP